MLRQCELSNHILQLCNKSPGRETTSYMHIYNECVDTYLCTCSLHLVWRWCTFINTYAAFSDRISISWVVAAIAENIEVEYKDKGYSLCQYKRVSWKCCETHFWCVWMVQNIMFGMRNMPNNHYKKYWSCLSFKKVSGKWLLGPAMVGGKERWVGWLIEAAAPSHLLR
jgi:hypothetical protein